MNTTQATAAPSAEGQPTPINMVLHCPACGLQHIDGPDNMHVWDGRDQSGRNHVSNEGPGAWSNPPHRSHLCHGCGYIWRPADVPTNGVKAVKTKGKADSPIAARAPADSVTAPAAGAAAGPDAKDADGHHFSVKAGWSLHGYRQGTKEGIAFHRGAMWWHAAAPTPAAQAADSVLEDAALLEFKMRNGSAIDRVSKQGANHD